MSTAESPRASEGRIAAVVMGVAGSGKSTLGARLAHELGVLFIDGDDLHPTANIAKMSAGTPLDDADRWPWLDSVGARLADEAAYPPGVVIACSALRRRYRDRIRAAAPSVRFVFLSGRESDMATRLVARPGHFMPSTLVASQFQVLEPPTGEDDVVTLAATDPLPVLVAGACAFLVQGTRPLGAIG